MILPVILFAILPPPPTFAPVMGAVRDMPFCSTPADDRAQPPEIVTLEYCGGSKGVTIAYTYARARALLSKNIPIRTLSIFTPILPLGVWEGGFVFDLKAVSLREWQICHTPCPLPKRESLSAWSGGALRHGGAAA